MELAKMEQRHEMDRGNFIYLRNKDTNSDLEILRKVPQQPFQLDILNMLLYRSINHHSNILALSLFLAEKNIWSVWEKLRSANVNPEAKHQVALSRHYHLSKSIILDIH